MSILTYTSTALLIADMTAEVAGEPKFHFKDSMQ